MKHGTNFIDTSRAVFAIVSLPSSQGHLSAHFIVKKTEARSLALKSHTASLLQRTTQGAWLSSKGLALTPGGWVRWVACGTQLSSWPSALGLRGALRRPLGTRSET